MSTVRKPKPALNFVQDEATPEPVQPELLRDDQTEAAETIEAGDLTATDTIDVIAARLRENPNLLPQVTEQASKAYRLARAVAPAELVDPTWQHLQRCYGHWKNKAAGNLFPGSPEGFAQRANMVQIALVAIAFLEKFPRKSRAEMSAMWNARKDDAARALAQHTAACAVEHGREQARPIEPAEIIRRFAARGITLAIGASGSLNASPARSLKDPEKAFLKANKAAVIEYLNSSETVA